MMEQEALRQRIAREYGMTRAEVGDIGEIGWNALGKLEEIAEFERVRREALDQVFRMRMAFAALYEATAPDRQSA